MNYLQSKGIQMTGELRNAVKVVVPVSGGKDSQACLKLAVNEVGSDNT